ncbi:hypothetical protein BT96DRAFT_978072 [Gymnopus androsaceus JB14]|uniref:Uncharacterized protein n=1 Tax=Gymnopus androsaceus JB14 TaxID=1447944 RepID=A0A6A4HE09_9AGAR|nr:hypothetical protein BT96DRAFT_978072 [Gymnopus androsaceus JB14]
MFSGLKGSALMKNIMVRVEFFLIVIQTPMVFLTQARWYENPTLFLHLRMEERAQCMISKNGRIGMKASRMKILIGGITAFPDWDVYLHYTGGLVIIQLKNTLRTPEDDSGSSDSEEEEEDLREDYGDVDADDGYNLGKTLCEILISALGPTTSIMNTSTFFSFTRFKRLNALIGPLYL